jgi:hypothetical protein
MSSLATAYICEEKALDDLANLFAKSLKTHPTRKKILEFMREAAKAPNRTPYGILILTGLSDLINTKYCNSNIALSLFKESLKKVSRDTILLVQVKNVEWSPTARHQVSIDRKIVPVSDLDLETTLRLQRQQKIRNFIIAKI